VRKDIIIIITVVMVIFGGGIYTKTYLQTSGDKIIEELRELEGEIERIREESNAFENYDMELEKKRLKDMSNRIYDEWKEMMERWSVIVLHTEIDMIGVSLISMKSNIRTGNYDRALEEIARSIFLIEDIVEKERVALRNIL